MLNIRIKVYAFVERPQTVIVKQKKNILVVKLYKFDIVKGKQSWLCKLKNIYQLHIIIIMFIIGCLNLINKYVLG